MLYWWTICKRGVGPQSETAHQTLGMFDLDESSFFKEGV